MSAEETGTKAAAAAAPAPAENNNGMLKMLVAFLGLSTAGLLAATIVLAVKDDASPMPEPAPATTSGMSMAEIDAMKADLALMEQYLTATPPQGENQCAGKKKKEFDFDNVQCFIDGVAQVGEQAAGNVTKGYRGKLGTDVVPLTKPYHQAGLCPVNVHWHLGAEHLSVGQYDDKGTGPSNVNERRRLAGEVRQGFQCSYYDETDAKFTTPYDWKFCENMEVGQTYEVHWPHSAAGACGTPNQYQSPFYDGVFCGLNMEVFSTLGRQDIANAVGVQAQIFTVVNDESYYYPNLFNGMIVEGDKGADMAMYTGSTTGNRNNDDQCSQYTPITWQVDRTCHLISASTFDKMCADMKAQRDDMSIDIAPHYSRPLVADELTADNQHDRYLRRK